jgi:ankyrin repeat protein
MAGNDLRLLIEKGDLEGLSRALQLEPTLANEAIHWTLNQANTSDPLHFVSDCVGHGWLADAKASDLAKELLAHGASIDGSAGRETPLIAAASLGAGEVARVLIEAGAALERTSVFGARALHWAAWTGEAATVGRLVTHGASLEARCSEFGATPLFWAIHGFGPAGPKPTTEQVEAARLLIRAGARIDTANKHGLSALELAGQCEGRAMLELVQQHLK